jgi:hypothetical protein
LETPIATFNIISLGVGYLVCMIAKATVVAKRRRRKSS